MSAEGGESATGGVVVGKDGLSISRDIDGIMNIHFDGRRIWSVNSAEYPVRIDGRWFVPWPDLLRPYLSGRVEIRLVDQETGETASITEATFGDGEGRVEVIGDTGRPLAMNKYGRFNQPFDTVDRDVLDGYLDQVEKVLDVLANECGLEAFVCWGTLLGAVRGGKMIGHDVDADLAYYSHHTHPADIARESYRVEAVLRAKGWNVRRENTGFLALFLPQVDGSVRNMDVFAAWITDGLLYVIHDIRAPLPASAILPLGEVELEGRRFPAPADPPALLEAAYGPDWSTPDPSFRFKASRVDKRRLNGWVGGLRAQRDYWLRFYGGPEQSRIPTEHSLFAEWVAERDDPGRQLVDAGSGNGRDLLWFRTNGRRAVGLEFSNGPIKLARTRARRLGTTVKQYKVNLNDLRYALAYGASFARQGPNTVYARMLIDTMRIDVRDNFYRFASMCCRDSGMLFLEFRAEPAGEKSYAFGAHERHPSTGDEVTAKLRRFGFAVVDRAEGRGLAPFEDEDPYMCRLAAEWRR